MAHVVKVKRNIDMLKGKQMSNTSNPIRVGIVGAGANTRAKHIPGLQAIDNVEIVSVVNKHPESSERVAQEFNIPTIYDSWEELVNAPDSDAIVIGTWPYLHYPVTLAALKAGKHVMCEARMAMNADEARRMHDAAKDHPELVTQVVPSPFTLKVDKTVKELLQNGYVGDLLAVEIHTKSGQFLDRDAALNWRQDADLSGMNIMTLGIWYESLLRWIGGAAQVRAHGNVFVSRRRDPETGVIKKVNIPDHLVVVADMAGGAQTTFLLSQITGGVKANNIYLFGSYGTLHFSDGVLYGFERGDDKFAEISIPPEKAGGWRVEEEFIGAIRGTEKITHTTFEDGVKYMEFTEAVNQSMIQEKPISLRDRDEKGAV